MTPITVSVSPEDIQRGVRRHRESCPLALALRRMFPGEPVTIGGYCGEVGPRGWRHSKAMRRWLCRFDNNKPVAATTFRVRFYDTTQNDADF
jgi:hypothetical protein